MKSINIKGKEYITVNERLKFFRDNYPDYSLTTKVLKLDENMVVMQAEIKDKEDRVLANGTAYERADSSFINKTSYIENCESSAWGRALGNFGIILD